MTDNNDYRSARIAGQYSRRRYRQVSRGERACGVRGLHAAAFGRRVCRHACCALRQRCLPCPPRCVGEEDDGYVFENGPAPIARLDVFAYRPTADLDMTTFTTVGMSAQPMPASPGPGAGGRAELHFARRGAVGGDDEYAIARQLANLAVEQARSAPPIQFIERLLDQVDIFTAR